jgi:diguanylate cyclase (GGDEF)-like protein
LDTRSAPAGPDAVAGAVPTARAVAGVIRREDIFGRYGGEEFGLACRGASRDGIRRTAERLREAVERTVVEIESTALRVTASFGVALCPAVRVASAAELITAADAAMYRAKALGRNRVETTR